MNPVVRFENVSKCYQLGLTRTSVTSLAGRWLRNVMSGTGWTRAQRDVLWALRDVSFDLQPGESLALVGPNGAGKSTVLKLLSRITQPTSGRLEVSGQLAALIELGAGFHPDLTGRENIYLNGTLLGLPKREIDRRFDEIVSFAELDRFIDTPIKRYSSGMTVRLGFAVASCIEPDILLVDEVLAVGDAAFRQKCVGRIKALLGNGTSLIFVSHDSGLVKAVCSTGIYLEGGVVQTRGATGDVIDAYNATLEKRRAAKMQRAGQSADGTSAGLEITHVDVLDADGSPCREFHPDQAAEIRIRYVAYRSIEQANVLARIYRSDGLSCCVVRTSADGFRVGFDRGEGTVSLRLEPLQLFGGTYHVVAWVMDADDASGLSRATSEWFDVRNRARGLDPDDGVFEPARRWAHERAT